MSKHDYALMCWQTIHYLTNRKCSLVSRMQEKGQVDFNCSFTLWWYFWTNRWHSESVCSWYDKGEITCAHLLFPCFSWTGQIVWNVFFFWHEVGNEIYSGGDDKMTHTTTKSSFPDTDITTSDGSQLLMRRKWSEGEHGVRLDQFHDHFSDWPIPWNHKHDNST